MGIEEQQPAEAPDEVVVEQQGQPALQSPDVPI
jgi:hypothetical protein